MKLLRHNFGMKLLALILALTAWGFTRALDPIENWVLEAAVEVQLRHGTTLVAIDEYDTTVTVYASGPASRLQRLQSAAPKAILNCRNIPAGEARTVDLRLDRRISGVAVEIEPENFEVTVNDIATREFVPEEVLIGTLPPGLQVNSVTGIPSVVEVSGADTFVNQVDRVIYTVNQWSLSAGSTDLVVDFTPVDELSETVPELAVDPDSSDVEVSLASVDHWTIGVYPVYTGDLPPNYRVTGFFPDPQVIGVTGPRELLSEITEITTEPVSLSGHDSTFTQTVRLIAPSGVTLSTDTVTVRVSIQPVIQPYPFNALPVQIRDTDDANYEYTFDTTTVDVVVEALPTRTDTVTPDLIIPSISLRGYGPGTHEVTINVGKPSGTQIVSVNPQVITVTITGEGSTSGDDQPSESGTPSEPE